MALQKLDFMPGINKENTPYSVEGGWVDSDKIRFRSGRPEKINGWDKFYANQLIGATRKLHVFRTLDGTIYVAIATNEKVYIEYGGTVTDITPVRETQALSGAFDTTAGSAVITVTDVSHGADDGAYITISGAATTDGIPDTEINAEHQITVIDADTYTFTVTTTASAGVTGGGGASISVEYQINPGAKDGVFQFGWGTGPYGSGTFGTPRTSSNATLHPRTWSLQNWGEDLVMNYHGGAVYIWDATTPLVRAVQITEAPHKVNNVVVTKDRHLVCFGCNEPGTANANTDLDLMRVRWCSQEDYTAWDPEITNTAGDNLMTNGTEIMAAGNVEGQVIIWTDDAVESMQYIGPPYTFGFQKVGSSTGIVSPDAWAAYNNTVYWMSDDGFYIFSGGVGAHACTVNRFIFDNLNINQRRKVFAVLNRDNHEVTWFYPTDDVEDTSLNGAITATDTSITVATTASFLSSGYIQIGSELIEYTGKTDTKFTGCVRGTRGTTAAAHADEAVVFDPDNKTPTEPCRYVTYSVLDKLWWVGRMERSAWTDKGALGNPIAATAEGYLYNHDVGNDADGDPLVAYVESADFDIAEGDNMMFIHRVFPDFTVDGSLDLIMRSRYYPLSPQIKEVIGTVTSATTKIDTRIRGRQMALRIQSDSLGDYWKYGATRIDQRPDGRR